MKKRSYFEKVRILIWLQCTVLLLVVGLGVWEFFGDAHFAKEQKKALWMILAVLAAAFLLASVWMAYTLPKRYHILCQKFMRGEIYQEFIDHIGSLTPDLSGAIGRLDSMLDRQRLIWLSTKQAELLALQNQINPHFLYNTLDAIRGDALCIGADNIADITEALSTFFRYTITDTKNLVTLQAELDNVENYFKIQKYRFGEKLSLMIHFGDSSQKLMQMRLPKLSLQPIVENAIFHGIEKKSEKGQITIDIEMVDQNLCIDISDDGIGMEEEQLLNLNEQLRKVSMGFHTENENGKKGGIALKNVCRRIKLLFGEAYGIHVSSIAGLGTKVEIVLPVVIGDEER